MTDLTHGESTGNSYSQCASVTVKHVNCGELHEDTNHTQPPPIPANFTSLPTPPRTGSSLSHPSMQKFFPSDSVPAGTDVNPHFCE